MRFIFLFILLIISNSSFAQELEGNEFLLKSIFFGGGSYSIDNQQNEELTEFIKNIPHIERYEIIVNSFTDNIGSMEYNQWLSKMRSEAVIHLLMELDIPQEIIYQRDFGEQAPVYTNDTWVGKQMNRRVDVILKPLEF